MIPKFPLNNPAVSVACAISGTLRVALTQPHLLLVFAPATCQRGSSRARARLWNAPRTPLAILSIINLSSFTYRDQSVPWCKSTMAVPLQARVQYMQLHRRAAGGRRRGGGGGGLSRRWTLLSCGRTRAREVHAPPVAFHGAGHSSRAGPNEVHAPPVAYHGAGHSSRAAERELVHVCAGDNPDAVQRAPRSSRPRRAPAARRARGLRPEFDQHGANLKVFFLDVCHGWGGVRVGMARTTQVKLKLQTCVVVAGTARLTSTSASRDGGAACRELRGVGGTHAGVRGESHGEYRMP